MTPAESGAPAPRRLAIGRARVCPLCGRPVAALVPLVIAGRADRVCRGCRARVLEARLLASALTPSLLAW